MGLCASSSDEGIKRMGTHDEVRQWREEVVIYRQKFKQAMQRSQALVTRRTDVYCECLELPWKPSDSYDVGDLLHSTFEKSTVEINMAFKGGRFNQRIAGVHIEMNYAKSLVLVLKSKSSNSVCCACLMVVHSTSAGDVFEIIWFATREKKQNQGFGTTLFRRACQAAKASGAKGLLITANDNVALWWMSLSNSVTSLQFHPIVVRNGKTSDSLQRSTEKGHGKRMKKVPKFTIQSTPDSTVNNFYVNCDTGKPFRYGPSLTVHIWYLSSVRSSGMGNISGTISKNASRNIGKSSIGTSSKYASQPPRSSKRKKLKTVGKTVQAAVKFDKRGGRGNSRFGR